MSSMELFIVVVAAVAAAIGTLVLLICLAGKHAQLFKAFELRQQTKAHEKMVQQNANQHNANKTQMGDSGVRATKPTSPSVGSAIPTAGKG